LDDLHIIHRDEYENKQIERVKLVSKIISLQLNKIIAAALSSEPINQLQDFSSPPFPLKQNILGCSLEMI